MALLPLLTSFSQILVNIGPYFNITVSSKLSMMLGAPMTALITVLNPLVTLLTVKNYRRLIFKCNKADIQSNINNNQTIHTAFSNRNNVIVPQ
uniref:7TM_GPCR_Srx domain-containing protein n=1 Tax=Meloidogyne floridensis TaxID=298350 RepID=A0A915P754_9BILA